MSTPKKKVRRARSDAAKTARRGAILKAAARLFENQRYDSITVDAIARACRLAKGTVYLYFPTKEAIFLELLLGALEAWFQSLDASLHRIRKDDARAVATLLATSMAKLPVLRRLLGLLHQTLERNVDEGAVRSFKLRAAAAMARPADHLEERLPRLRKGDGLRLFMHLHALVVGVGQVSDVSSVVAKVLEDPALAPFRVDFTGELSELLVLVLEGWHAR